METVTEEAPVLNPPVEGVKSTNKPSEISDAEVCKKSNGVAETSDTPEISLENNIVDAPVAECPSTSCSAQSEIQVPTSKPVEYIEPCSSNQETVQKMSSTNSNIIVEEQTGDNTEQSGKPNDTEVSGNSKSQDLQNPMLVDNINSAKEELTKEMQNENNENVKFETEILIETNDNDVNELDLNSTKEVSSQESGSNILSELGQNIELSEALRSSDNAENGDNNNHTMRQEVFNKEELLDILEGNDVQASESAVGYEIEIKVDNDGKSEAQLALEQLSRLKKSRSRKRRSSDVMSRKRNISVSNAESNSNAVESKKVVVKSKKEDGGDKSKKSEGEEKVKKDSKREDSIVNKLVEDWDDDEPVDDETDLNNKCDSTLNSSEQLVESQETIVNQDVTARTSIDSAISDGQTPNKGNEDCQPQRRLGRVIKKKVIYDPDNPDTFTKSKISVKKEPQTEDSSSKKIKIESPAQRPKSKSPVSKQQWKKPQPKNSKQNRRLTEVDKLLMDEGAVNMIYQLTPEAPKGKKNMRTKAEFIKKIQSSTPETKEMKFRERKIKIEEGEAKKIMGSKQRPSLSSSVKSVSVCEDFETHSADDSIIYRRHSSSSYSSTCMSPRRLSDVEGGGVPTSQNKSVPKETGSENDNMLTNTSADLSTDVFVPDVENISTDIINKDDCLSIKEKLNSKLSLALNKRKRESSKMDKPLKQRKLSKLDKKVKSENDRYIFLSVSYDQRVAEILIRKTGSKYNNVMFKELCQALEEVDTNKDISVTLLMSECGALCSDLDLSSLINDDIDERTNSAYEYAEDIRLVLFAMIQHSKLLVSGVWGACSGVALALVALSDVALASEGATFALAPGPERPVLPGIMLLSSPWQSLPPTLVNDLVIFGCTLSAREVHSGGLVSRVLLPAGPEAVRLLARDIAKGNPKNILMKKRLLNLKNASNTFLSCLIKERDLILNYWTSTEGQELLRATTTA